MALTKCPDCGHEVSMRASACPQCGAPMFSTPPPPPARAQAKPAGCLSYIVAGLVLMAIVGMIVDSTQQEASPPTPRPAKKQQELTPEEQAAKAAEAEKRLKARALDLMAGITTAELKNATRNPDRFQLEQVLAMDATQGVCISARAENGFGGMNHLQAVLATKGEPQFLTSEQDGFYRLWNQVCAGETGRDITREIRRRVDGGR